MSQIPDKQTYLRIYRMSRGAAPLSKSINGMLISQAYPSRTPPPPHAPHCLPPLCAPYTTHLSLSPPPLTNPHLHPHLLPPPYP